MKTTCQKGSYQFSITYRGGMVMIALNYLIMLFLIWMAYDTGDGLVWIAAGAFAIAEAIWLGGRRR